MTDASLEGYGGHWKDEIFQGTWNDEQKLSSLNLLELTTIWLALERSLM